MTYGFSLTAVKTKNPRFIQFLGSLDEKSRAILCYLWWNRHAEISELRKIGGTADDFELLFRLKEVINCQSIIMYGQPSVSFEQSKVDSLTGQKVLFNWWFVGPQDEALVDGGPLLMDVFNEPENVTIIAQLPASVELAAPDIQFRNGILKIVFKKTIPQSNN